MQPSHDDPLLDSPLNNNLPDLIYTSDFNSFDKCNIYKMHYFLSNMPFNPERREEARSDLLRLARKIYQNRDDIMNQNCHQDSEPVRSLNALDQRLEEPNLEENHNNFCSTQFSEHSGEIHSPDENYFFPFDNEYHRIFGSSTKENQDLPEVDANPHEPALSNSSGSSHGSKGSPAQSSFPTFTLPRTENYNLGAVDLPGFCQEGVLRDENQIQSSIPKTQQEHIQPRQSPQNTSSQSEERAHSIESNGLLSGAPSKKVKVESHQASFTNCSTADNQSSTGSLGGSPQAENYNDALNGDDASSHIHSEEEHKQGVNEAALKKKKTTKTGFSPHRSAMKTLANSILRYLQKDFLFRWVIEQEVCIKYKVPMKNIETYIECLVKSSVTNETELFNAIGNAGPKGTNSHFLFKEEAKRATWLLFQIFLGKDGHLERWVDDPVIGYQPHSKSKKGEKIDKKSPEYLAKQQKKREIYKKEGEREKLRKIFENSALSANPGKGRKKNNSAKKTKPEKKEEYIVYEEFLIEEISEVNES